MEGRFGEVKILIGCSRSEMPSVGDQSGAGPVLLLRALCVRGGELRSVVLCFVGVEAEVPSKGAPCRAGQSEAVC